MNYTIGIVCAAIIALALYSVLMLTDKSPDPSGEMKITVVDPPEGSPATPEINQSPESDPIYRNVEGDPLFMKAGGAAKSGRWYGIRVDEYGRVICSPEPPKIYPWDMSR